MPKTKQQKQAAVAQLAASLKDAKGAVFANFQGLTVAAAEELRGKCREEEIGVMAIKKTLAKKAFADAGLTDVDPTSFEGGVAAFTGANDEVVAARVVNNFAKTHEVVSIFGGVLEGKFIDSVMVKNLANLPSKQQLLAQVVGTINAPISGLVNALAGNLRNLVGVLNNIKESKA